MPTTSPDCIASTDPVGRASPRVHRRTARLAIAAALASLLASCGGGGGGGGSPGPPTVQVIDAAGNSSSDGSTGATTDYDVLFGTTTVATNLAYGNATALTTESTGSLTIVVEPTGTTTTTTSGGTTTTTGNNPAALTTSVAVAFGFNYSVLVVTGSSTSTTTPVTGTTSTTGTTTSTTTSTLTPIVVAADNAPPPSGQAKLALVNAASSAGTLDIYLTTPTATLPSSPTVSALTFPGSAATGSAQATAAVQLTGGSYRLRATAAGDTTQAIVFDSGPITFEAGTLHVLAVVPATGSASKVALLDAPATGGVVQLRDQRVLVRAGNFSPSLAGDDALLLPYATANTTLVDVTLATDLLPGAVGSTYTAVLPGAYQAQFAPTGTTTPDVAGNISLGPDTSSSLYAIGLVNATGTQTLQVLQVTDDLNAPPVGQGKVRLLQLASNELANPIDLVSLDATNTIAQTLVGNVAYPGASSYVNLTPGTYTLNAVLTGTTQLLLPITPPVTLTVSEGSIYSVIVCSNPGTGACPATGAAIGIVTTPDN